jgi:RNA polymerase sigma-70 factor (ECF subfamily)
MGRWEVTVELLAARSERRLDKARRMDETPDGTLVRLAREGSVAACEALIRRYQDRIYTIAYSYVHDPEEALDITQDTFLRMIEGLSRFREQANVYTWLYRIVVNQCIDRGRKKNRRPPPQSLQDLEGDRAAELTETRSALCPEAALEARELREQIQRAIAAVPEIYRMAVILADIEGLSMAEIAQVLGCRVTTVRTRLHRGRTVVRQRLENYLKGEEYV